MKPSTGKWLLVIWLAFQAGLLFACQPVPTDAPVETTPGTPALTTAPPQPTQTRDVRLKTTTPQPSLTPTQPSGLRQVKPSALRGLKVEFWYTASGEADVYLRSLVGEFNRTNTWGITIRPVNYPSLGVLEEEVRLAQGEKRLPGLIAAYTNQARRWDTSGTFLTDLTPFVADQDWGLASGDQQDFYPRFWAQDLITRRSNSGSSLTKRLGVPWYRSGLVMLYNRTWAEELGSRSLPDTPEKFRQQMCAAAQANHDDQDRKNDGTGGWLITRDPLLLVGWIHAFGGEVMRADGSGYTFQTPAAEKAGEYIVELIAKGCAWSTVDETAPDAFAARRTLAWIGSLSSLPVQQQALKQAGSADEWVVLPFPVNVEDPIIETYGPGLYVVKSSPAQELAAWLFVRWLLSAKNQAGWAEANGVFPVRAAALQPDRPANGQLTQWSQALVWLPYAWDEPAMASWGSMRGVLNDALEQMLAPDFQLERVTALLTVLDDVAAEVVSQVR